MTDPEFLAFCLSHASGVARFHRGEVVRLYALAGHSLAGNLDEWLTLRDPIVRPLVEQAR